MADGLFRIPAMLAKEGQDIMNPSWLPQLGFLTL